MDQTRFEALKQKYSMVLTAIQQQGIRLEHLHEENGKLIIAGRAPSDAAKNKIWDKIKQVDPAYQDLKADITLDASMAPRAEEQTYTVEAGDTLSQISKQFYGEASLYMNIFEANRDQLKDPNKIQPGMRLRIPISDKQAIS